MKDEGELLAYWLANFVVKDMCGLCAQSGVIDTVGIRTPAGFECGGLFFCICPNGQALKKIFATPEQIKQSQGGMG